MTLTVGERRRIGRRAAFDPAFYAWLHRTPHEAVQQEVGRSIPRDRPIEVTDEGDDWTVVLVDHDGIDTVLPDADDTRSAVENEAYAMLRDQPALYDDIERDPRGFVERILGYPLEDEKIVLQRDDEHSIKLVVYHGQSREDLSDDMLDLVSGGGSPTCNLPTVNNQRK